MKVLPVGAWDDEKLNVLVASGTIPDVFIGPVKDKWYTDGVVRPITMEMLKTYAPNMTGYVDKVGGPYAWDLVGDTKTENLTGVPCITSGVSPYVIAARKDWMDHVGATAPETLDALHDLLKKFTFNDPDQNGKNDTYGFPTHFGDGAFKWNNIYIPVFGAFGVGTDQWVVDEDGKVAYSAVTKGYKEALKVLQSWWKEGLMDPSLTDKTADITAKIMNNKIGTEYTSAQYMMKSNPTDLYSLYMKNPKAEPVFFPPIKGSDGKDGQSSYRNAFGWAMHFGCKAPDEKVIRVDAVESCLSRRQYAKILKSG